MSFYKDFASVYNRVFPFNKTKHNFLNNHLPQGLILDIACATGQYTKAISSKTRQVIGIDTSREMIEETLDSPYTRYLVKDMTTIKDKAHYDGVYSVGNSLVHITNKDDIYSHLQSLFNALKDEGTLLLQIVNYDRILNNNVKALPPIEIPTASLKRHYELKNNLVYFQTTLKVEDKVYKNETPLYPLTYSELTTMLAEIGFSSIQPFGSFEETTYNHKSSFHLIVKATKPIT